MLTVAIKVELTKIHAALNSPTVFAIANAPPAKKDQIAEAFVDNTVLKKAANEVNRGTKEDSIIHTIEETNNNEDDERKYGVENLDGVFDVARGFPQVFSAACDATNEQDHFVKRDITIAVEIKLGKDPMCFGSAVHPKFVD